MNHSLESPSSVSSSPSAQEAMPRVPARDRLFYVFWTGAEARVTHEPTEVRAMLRWQDGHGGRVFVMSRMADCAALLTTAPKPVQQSVRQFLQALSHGQSLHEAEEQSRVVFPDGTHAPHAPAHPKP